MDTYLLEIAEHFDERRVGTIRPEDQEVLNILVKAGVLEYKNNVYHTVYTKSDYHGWIKKDEYSAGVVYIDKLFKLIQEAQEHGLSLHYSQDEFKVYPGGGTPVEIEHLKFLK
ncbi:MAG: hypothetical protein DWQ19_09330 [Crenarchaeota archaeon]|nr:MAG: hypothetical protein DWQ19_09330 [Thermoproteota archaeon]